MSLLKWRIFKSHRLFYWNVYSIIDICIWLFGFLFIISIFFKIFYYSRYKFFCILRNQWVISKFRKNESIILFKLILLIYYLRVLMSSWFTLVFLLIFYYHFICCQKKFIILSWYCILVLYVLFLKFILKTKFLCKLFW